MFSFQRQCRTIEQQVAVEVQVWTNLATVESRGRLRVECLFLLVYCLLIYLRGVFIHFFQNND